MAKTKETIEDIISDLYSYFLRWKTIYLDGCQDPFWEDGVNLNLVRNRILYGKTKIEQMLGEDYIKYPDAYFFPEPPELPNDFMAQTRMCRQTEIPVNKQIPFVGILKFDWSEAFC